MVSVKSVEKQLKRLKFNLHSWGRSEVAELPHILMPDEVIYECVNGMYEGGFALLVATDLRVLLVDKKPLNYLTVEDLRFDMINELDYSHRLVGAQITISAGAKSLKFKSYNQARLRKLISHVQHCMADSKKQVSAGQQDQKQHLEQINQQLQVYLIAQHQQQQALRDQLAQAQSGSTERKPPSNLPPLPQPSPELSDFLFAQSLLKQYRENEAKQISDDDLPSQPTPAASSTQPVVRQTANDSPQLADLYAEGMKEIFGKKDNQSNRTTANPQPTVQPHNPLEINALTIAYSKLPMALRNRKFGRPSLHAHSQQARTMQAPQQPTPAN